MSDDFKDFNDKVKIMRLAAIDASKTYMKSHGLKADMAAMMDAWRKYFVVNCEEIAKVLGCTMDDFTTWQILDGRIEKAKVMIAKSEDKDWVKWATPKLNKLYREKCQVEKRFKKIYPEEE